MCPIQKLITTVCQIFRVWHCCTDFIQCTVTPSSAEGKDASLEIRFVSKMQCTVRSVACSGFSLFDQLQSVQSVLQSTST